MNWSIILAGAAGHGLNLAENLLIKHLTKQGYYFHAYKDYMSRVRGGLNYVHITFADAPVNTHAETVDVLIALTEEAALVLPELLSKEGLLVTDSSYKLEPSSHKVSTIDIKSILSSSQNPKGMSVLALGLAAKAFGISRHDLPTLLPTHWQDLMKDKNLLTAELAYDSCSTFFKLTTSNNKNHIVMSGNQAVALGAIAAGLSFYAAYPMAPSTSVMNHLMSLEKRFQLVVEQVEDEIAAINAVIGATASGVRAMTASSGGGISLMVEGIGLAAVAEVPLVLLDVQRPGPATGMATRTEQSDLNFVLNASQGEFPRMILSYKNIEDAFYQTFRAFNLADKYRIPVIMLSDQYLADSMATVPVFDVASLEINRYILENDMNPNENYAHHSLETLIQERAIPGWTDRIIMNDSHEHDENASVTEDAENRVVMNMRRMKKLELLHSEVLEPEFIGSDLPKTVLLSWGSTSEQLREAVHMLNSANEPVAGLLFNDLYPLPSQQLKHWHSQGVKFVTVEGNYQGQLAQLIARELGIWIDDSILKFDGRQMTPDYIMSLYKELMA